MTYHISIDPSLCCGYGGCIRSAPQIFALVKGIAVARTAETDDENVLEAADTCPMGAITVEEVPGLAA